MSKVLHEPSEAYIAAHMNVCQKKPRKGHYGVGSIKRRCARELYSKCIELGIKPVLHYGEYQKAHSTLVKEQN